METGLVNSIARSRTERFSGETTWWVAILVLGLTLSILMVARSQVTVDQYNLLARGWRFAVEGELVPYGVWATGGGRHPGILTSLAVGLPLLVWLDFRAPALLILATHLCAFLLLGRVLRPALGIRERVFFAALYWLSPWRLFYSGFLWNPNLLIVFGALHLATARALRDRPRFWTSVCHVAVLGGAVQFHVSAVLLVAATGVLWWRRLVRLHLGGALLGAALVCASLVPWALAVIESPSLLPLSGSSIGHGFETGLPIAQGIMNWLRFAAVGFSRSMACLDFAGLGGPARGALPGLFPLLRLFNVLTILVALWANWRLWRHAGAADDRADGERLWLEDVVRSTFVAAVVVFGLSPIGVPGHGLLSVMHIAVLPMVFALGALSRSLGARRLRLAIGAHVALVSLLGLAMALGSPAYRCAGPRCGTEHFRAPALAAEHPMLDALGIRGSCAPAIDSDGWWPDGLEPPLSVGEGIPSTR